nr:hypothetical protein [Tanacetum cinerariifolium]
MRVFSLDTSVINNVDGGFGDDDDDGDVSKGVMLRSSSFLANIMLLAFLMSAPDGKVLLRYGPQLLVCDLKDSSSSEIENFDGTYEACILVESLVSPFYPLGLAVKSDDEYCWIVNSDSAKSNIPKSKSDLRKCLCEYVSFLIISAYEFYPDVVSFNAFSDEVVFRINVLASVIFSSSKCVSLLSSLFSHNACVAAAVAAMNSDLQDDKATVACL